MSNESVTHRHGVPCSVTVVVVTFRARSLLAACLDSLAAQSMPHHLLIVDNNSDDGTERYLAGRLDRSQILRLPKNLGFAGGVAAAMSQIDTEFVALLNDDAEAEPTWLEELCSVAVVDPAAAAWTSLLLLKDRPGVVNNAGVMMDNHWYGSDIGLGDVRDSILDDVVQVFGFCGGAALLRACAVARAGGFPAQFFLYYEDLDTSWRLRLAGWQIRRVPAAVVRHAHSATSDQHSESFHFYNERNRLLTVIRCAPAIVALSATTRFVVTTGSLAIKRICRLPVPDAANFRTRLRSRVLLSVISRLPRALAARSRIGRMARKANLRRDFAEQWAGVQTRS